MQMEKPNEHIGKYVELVYDDLGKGIIKRGTLKNVDPLFITILLENGQIHLYPLSKIIKINVIADAGNTQNRI